MNTEATAELALARLLQLISPSLPIGGYTYSQGIEWAVESGWISDDVDLHNWLSGLLASNLAYLELPLLARLLRAWSDDDLEAVRSWSNYLLASRETRELRLEELNRARAFSQLLPALETEARQHKALLSLTQLTGYSYACVRWRIDFESAACGLLCSWIENLVLSAVKIIPLGQTAGQQLIYKLSEQLPVIIEQSQKVDDDDIGASSMALAIASSQHETQYTRLFRS